MHYIEAKLIIRRLIIGECSGACITFIKYHDITN